VTLPDVAQLCDAFYIGGTKQGAMFGEAVVIPNPQLAEDFRYMIKRQGGMLAKGWTMGLQFEALLEDGLYFEIARQANEKADRIRSALQKAGIPTPFVSTTNQVFAVMTDEALHELAKEFLFTEWERVDENHRMIRFCTSWSTTDEQVDALCKGEWDEALLAAGIANYKLSVQEMLEENESRADLFVKAFVNGMDWADMVNRVERMEKITKADVVNFAKKHLRNDNYAIVYKRQGVDTNEKKIAKPAITPIMTNRDLTS
jgi:hypothetical protein